MIDLFWLEVFVILAILTLAVAYLVKVFIHIVIELVKAVVCLVVIMVGLYCLLMMFGIV